MKNPQGKPSQKNLRISASSVPVLCLSFSLIYDLRVRDVLLLGVTNKYLEGFCNDEGYWKQKC